jgi:hypothetical protein
MNDEIVAYIRKHQPSGGVTSDAIAERFLRFKAPNKALADVAVRGILGKDARVRSDGGLWVPAAIGLPGGDGTGVSDVPWAAVYVLTDSAKKNLVHLSLWSPLPENKCICSVWLRDPAHFSEDDREQLSDPRDLPYDEPAAATAVSQAAAALAGRVPVFFSQQQYSIFTMTARNLGGGAGIDDYYLMNQFLRAIKEREPSPLTLDGAAATLLGGFRTAESAYSRGELWGRIAAELVGRMKSAGIESRGQLDAALYEESNCDFSGKEISAKMIEELPAGAGVYGFTDKAGAYVYIGKAVNLRRRIESYFRFNSESPDKLSKLRKEAHGLTIHRCGSELEALIYEYRLIKKHKPALNSQSAISERKGVYKPLPDSVVVLPHAQEGFCVSVWIKRDQKVRIRACEKTLEEEEALLRELREYFYSGTLPASPDDFPELEIVTRWVKRHRDGIDMINVENMADARGVLEAMESVF